MTISDESLLVFIPYDHFTSQDFVIFIQISDVITIVICHYPVFSFV